MATYTWPTNVALVPQAASIRSIVNARHNMSAESGVTQTITRPGSRWGWSITMPAMLTDNAAEFEAFLVRLSGMEHRASVFDWKRPTPRGTCNLTGVTVGSTAAQFATTCTLAGCGASKTLKAGDWIKFNSSGQLVMVAADATADGSGNMTIEFRHALRAQVAGGVGVTLDRPTALYVLADATIEVPRGPGRTQPGFGFDLMEVFS